MLKKLLNNRNVMLLLKSVVYRCAGTLATVLITLLLTGSFRISVSVGALECLSKIALYFFYDKFWSFMVYRIDLWRKYSE